MRAERNGFFRILPIVKNWRLHSRSKIYPERRTHLLDSLTKRRFELVVHVNYSGRCARGKSVAIAWIHALAGLGPAVGLALLAGVLIIGVTLLLRPFTFAFVWIIGDVVASRGLAGMILGQRNWN